MKCPGQDWRYWREDVVFEVSCPYCKESIEFFKDDTIRKCPSCKKPVPNPKMDFGCAVYCKYAEACLGELPPELIKAKMPLFKGRILAYLKGMLPKDLYYEIESKLYSMEEFLKKKQASLGRGPLIFLFYFLTEEKQRELCEQCGIPEVLWEELKRELKDIPLGLTPEKLKDYLIEREGFKNG